MAALRSDSPMSHSGTPVVEPIEVEQHLIGTSETDEEPPPDPGVAVDATSPPGIPLIQLPPPSTISEANFQKLMDYWQEVNARQEQRIQDLVEQIVNLKNEGPKKNDSKMALPSIDIKDVKKPDEYDGDEKGFAMWYTRFKGLLANRHPSWQGVFEAVEKFQGQAIENVNGKHDKFKEKLPDDSSVLKDPEIYAQQLLSYLSSYTKGNLHAKVMKTHDRNAFELLRDVVYKG